MDGTILSQGSFISSANNTPVNIPVPSGVDWVEVYNYTLFGTAGSTAPALGFQFLWQIEMPSDSALVWYKTNAAETVNADTITSGGIKLYDPTTGLIVGNSVATTATTNATRPVVSTGNTAGLAVGSVVRMSNTAQGDVNGIDMVVSAVTANTSFELLFASNALATAPGVIGGAGFYRIVEIDDIYYPRRRYVTNITQSVAPTVSTSVEHSLTPGQKIRFHIPQESGMTQLNPTAQNNYLSATVTTVVDAYSFTIEVDTSGFTAFTWPTAAQTPCDFPQVVPFGENTAASLILPFNQTPEFQGQQVYNSNSGILADSTVNTAFLGMTLGVGGTGTASAAAITGPAGSDVSQLIVWKVGKSSYGGQ